MGASLWLKRTGFQPVQTFKQATTLDMGSAGSLEVVVEKDFACLDRSDEDNSDSFANPHAGATC